MAKGVYVGVPDFEKVALPAGYTQVKFIQSSGTQYIDTGVTAEFPLEIEMRIKTLTGVGNSDQILLGVSSGATHINPIYIYNGQWVLSSGGTDAISETGSVKDNTAYNIKVTLTNGNQSLAVNGKTILSSSNATNGVASNLFLFARNNNGSATNLASVQIEEVRIRQRATLVRNLIPCVNASGEVGMYDLVNSKFYGNAGTGQFFAPVPVELPSGYKQVEWIQSSGVQYIDTGFIPKSTTRVVASFTMMQTDSKWYKLWGSGNGSYTNDFAMWASGTTKLQACYGNQNTTITCDGGYVDVDANKNVWVMDGVTSTLTAQTFTCNYPMYIFSVNRDTNSSYVNASMKLYFCKIWDNGTLVRNYIPCTNNSGTAGLYDLVNGTFYGNSGTGTFSVGAEISAEPKDVARKVKEIYVGISNKARRVKKGYIGIGGIARPFWGDYKLEYYGAVTSLSYSALYPRGTSVGDYALFGSGSIKGGYSNTMNAYSKNLTRTSPTTLSFSASYVSSTSLGNYALYGGGSGSSNNTAVNAYDTSLTRQILTSLDSDAGTGTGSASSNSAYAMFGGGSNGLGVNAYNTSLTKTSNITDLSGSSGSRQYVGSGHVGKYVLFLGGSNALADAYDTSLTKTVATNMSMSRQRPCTATTGGCLLVTNHSNSTSVVDVYNESLTRSTATPLSVARWGISAVTLGDYAIFASGGDSNVVDAYDKHLTRTTPDPLSNKMWYCGTASVGNYALFAGGYYTNNSSLSARVEAYVLK